MQPPTVRSDLGAELLKVPKMGEGCSPKAREAEGAGMTDAGVFGWVPRGGEAAAGGSGSARGSLRLGPRRLVFGRSDGPCSERIDFPDVANPGRYPDSGT